MSDAFSAFSLAFCILPTASLHYGFFDSSSSFFLFSSCSASGGLAAARFCELFREREGAWVDLDWESSRRIETFHKLRIDWITSSDSSSLIPKGRELEHQLSTGPELWLLGWGCWVPQPLETSPALEEEVTRGSSYSSEKGSLYSRHLNLSEFWLIISFWLIVLLVSVSAGDKSITSYFSEVINYINSGNYSWKAASNHVTAMGRRAHLLAGSYLTREDARALPFRHTVSRTPIPKTFDAREQWANCDSLWSIKDQGSCGSCWAVSTSSVMSDRVCIASGTQVQVNISAEQLTACCTDCGTGCNGGYPDRAWPYFRRHGLVTGGDYQSHEGCQPYEVAPTGSASDTYLVCSPHKCTNKDYAIPYKQDLHYGKTAYFLPNDERSIQAEIMTNGPVVAGFTVYNDFFSYSSGVYKHVTGDLAGGHAVRILGWGVESGVNYWLIANSWNRTWGDGGYVKFIRGINNCGIEEFVTAGLVESN